MNQEAKSQEFLRRLAMIHEGFVQDKARLGLDLARVSALDPKTAALIVVGAVVAIGASAACLRWSASRALAAGATEGEITEVLLVIAPVTGLGCVVSAAPELAVGLGYDIEAALFDLDEPNDSAAGIDLSLSDRQTVPAPFLGIKRTVKRR